MRAILLVALALMASGCAGHLAFAVGCDPDTYIGGDRPAWVEADLGLCPERGRQ